MTSHMIPDSHYCGVHTGLSSVRVPDHVSKEGRDEYINKQLQQMPVTSAFEKTMLKVSCLEWGCPCPDLFNNVWYIHPGLPESIHRLTFQVKLERLIEGLADISSCHWPSYLKNGEYELILRIQDFQDKMDRLFRSWLPICYQCTYLR